MVAKNSEFSFVEASPEGRKLRASIQGPSGSGKTTTALRVATGIIQREGGRIAMIDVEEGRSKMESHRFRFDLMILREPYTADKFVRALAASAQHTVAIIDSATKEWEQLLAEKDSMSAKDQFTGWKNLNPKHDAFMQAIAKFPGHVIVTFRSKTKHEIQRIDGKATPVKLGMEPIARPQTEFEFDLALELDHDSRCTLAKRSRGIFNALGDYKKHEPGEELGHLISDALLGKLEGTEAMANAAAPPQVELTEAECNAQLRALADWFTPARCKAILGRSSQGMTLEEKRAAVKTLLAAQVEALAAQHDDDPPPSDEPPPSSEMNDDPPPSTLRVVAAGVNGEPGPDALPLQARKVAASELWTIAKQCGFGAVDVRAEMKRRHGHDSAVQLTDEQRGGLADWMDAAYADSLQAGGARETLAAARRGGDDR